MYAAYRCKHYFRVSASQVVIKGVTQDYRRIPSSCGLAFLKILIDELVVS